MRWVAIFDDKEDVDWIRKQHSQEHFDYLARHRDKILLAGGLRLRRGYRPNVWGKAPCYDQVTL